VIIEAFLYLSCILYAAEYALFLVGLRRVHRLPRAVPPVYPSLSVVVAARNEAANIERCLGALLRQDYPPERLQIILVNDESEDRTLRLAERVADENPGRLTILTTTPEETEARGKALAIAQGIDHATGEIILLTDADCAPPAVWARSAVEHFVPGVDVYGGFTLIHSEDLFSSIQQLDWVHLQTYGSCGLALDAPLGLIGNNFGFTRRAYDAVGGYRGIRFSMTEDYALFRAMFDRGFKVVFPCTHDTSMITGACASLAEVLRQKQRWAHGGTETGVKGWAVLFFAVLMMISMVVAPFISTTAWIIVWSTKFICDAVLMTPNLLRLKRERQLRHFLTFEFYFIAQAFVIPFLLMNPTVVWKGRSYRK
jgi:cellulose synthase/poly-beta-1,6-N-acetylglucosamine synthase-like glycosyltransferase